LRCGSDAAAHDTSVTGTNIMTRVVLWAQAFALSIGGLGLFLIALLDTSVLSLPEVSDILLVYMVSHHPTRMLYYAAMLTAGSVVGSLVIFYVGRKGGEALLRNRFKGDRVDRTLGTFRRYGVAAVIVPSMLPPPTPFKLFVLAAGASGMSAGTFSWSVAVGRGLRYLIEGTLAYYFGAAALDYLRAHGSEVALGLALVSTALLAVYYWRRRRTIPADV
jgi:membrane protein YqaA with SNARE-associated domain